MLLEQQGVRDSFDEGTALQKFGNSLSGKILEYNISKIFWLVVQWKIKCFCQKT